MKIAIAAGRFVSAIWNPVTMPLYAVLVLLYGQTVFAPLPGRLKFHYLVLVTLSTIVIPVLSIAMMRLAGIVGDLALPGRRERIAPLGVALLCYAACLLAFSRIPHAFMMRQVLAVGTVSIAVGLAVTLFWKISLHGIAAGAMVAILALAQAEGVGRLFAVVCLTVVMGGAVLSARLVLQKHTPAQVAAGFFAGLAAGAAILL